nr:hypothetical protein [Methylomarinum sp. Ch1-1]MDP4521712.1 hypothetical protein [Methylomarinum sp. Ch1-1]
MFAGGLSFVLALLAGLWAAIRATRDRFSGRYELTRRVFIGVVVFIVVAVLAGWLTAAQQGYPLNGF